MNINKRMISVGKLHTASIAYLSGFFGEIVTRGEMITLQEIAEKAGARFVGSNAWHMLRRRDKRPAAHPTELDTFARDAVKGASGYLLDGIRWRYGRQCKLFMEGYLDGLPEHLSLFDALEMMKKMAPSYFRGSAE